MVVSILAEGIKNTVINQIYKVKNKGIKINTGVKNKITF